MNIQAAAKARKAGEEMVADMKSRAPRESGFLADTIYYEVEVDADGVTITAGSEADYDYIQEYGSVHLAPNPFYSPAVDSQEPKFADALEDIGGIL